MNYRVTVLGEVHHKAHNCVSGFLVDIHSTQSRPIYCFKIQFSVCEGLNENLFELHVRVDTQTIFGNLQCRKFNCSSCRCLYRIKIFVVVLSLIYLNIILQRHSYVIEFGYYYAHTLALSKIRHRLDSFLKVVKEIAFLNFKVEALLCGLI